MFEADFFQYQGRLPVILNLIYIICSSHKTGRAITILKWTWKTDNCNLCSFLFLCIRKLPNQWSISGWFYLYLSHHQHFWTSMSLYLVTHLFSVTSAMLHRYFWPFSVQHFSNLSLKGNTIEFCSCPISYSVLKIALKDWEYLPIEEMENFAWSGFFMWWWESGKQWFWPFKPFLKLKSNSVKISPVGVNVKLCREDIFFLSAGGKLRRSYFNHSSQSS